ncbi:MAG: preprotein translocase subunit TatC, partial [bacterium]|nr:preprotein translocase subunit TatC [bacterium]
MTDQGDSPKPDKLAPDPDTGVEEFRMSFGDHLDELRSRLVMALIGLVVTTVLSLVYAREVLVVLCRPLLVVLDAHGLPPSLMAIGVTDPFVGYLKMALLSGLIVATPWILHQGWMFIAAGLYAY